MKSQITTQCRTRLKPENIPPQLADMKCWLLWTAGEPNPTTGKFDKLPVYANGTKRHGTQGGDQDVKQLVTLQDALAVFDAEQKYAGIGIACLPQFNLTIYDGDKCVKKGVVDPDRAKLTDETYTEISPSGTGIRAIWVGSSASQKNISNGHELFHNTGFVTVTGDKIESSWDLIYAPELPELSDEKRSELLMLTKTIGTSSPAPAGFLRSADLKPEQIQHLRSALNYMSSDDRELWIRVGQSLYSAGHAGFELWATWSQRSVKHQEGDLDKWDTFRADRTSWQSVFKMAQDRGWVNPVQKHFCEWPVPMDVFSASPVPVFPLGALPVPIREYAIAQSSLSGMDVGAYAFTSLMALIAQIDQRAKIQASDGWAAPPVVWVALVDASGGGKSPVMKAGTRFLDEANQVLIERSLSERRQWETIKGFAKIDKTLHAPPTSRQPPWNQLTASDATVEGLTSLLEDNPRGLVLVVDELTELIGRMDAYGGKGGDKDRGIYLTMYDGGSRTVNRAGGSHKFIPNLSVSVITGVQPEKLAAMYSKSGGQGADGMYQRFLCYVMQPRAAMQLGGELNPQVLDDVRKLSLKIEQWNADKVMVDQPCRLSTDAAALFQDFGNDFIVIAKRTDSARFREHLNKFPGFLLRLSFGLHVIECAMSGQWSKSVSQETMARARDILWALYHHSDAVYGVLDQDTGSRALTEAVAGVILAKEWEKFTWGDLTRHCAQFRSLTDSRVGEAVMDRLIAMGWIDDVTELKSGKGRPSKGQFLVNPEVHSKFKDQANLQKTARLERQAAFDRQSGRLKPY